MKRIYFDLILILIGVVLAIIITDNHQSKPAIEQVVNMEEALIVAQEESGEDVRCYQKCSGWGIGIGMGEMLGWSAMESEIICEPIKGEDNE